jgi:flagellar assembly factor FliW
LLTIAGGLAPFPAERFQVIEEKEAPPFLRLEAVEADLAFHVLDPFLIKSDYAPVLPDADEKALELGGAEETGILAIVNLHREGAPPTINLAAPIVINLRTGKAKQVILNNATEFSVRHALA